MHWLKTVGTLLILILVCGALGAQTLTPNVQFQLPAYQQTNWQVPIDFNFNTLDLILGGYLTLPTGTTPLITQTSTWVTANSGATTITNIRGGYKGQSIVLICGAMDSYTTLNEGTYFALASSLSFSCASAQAIRLTLIGTVWTETSRSGGGGGGGGGSVGPGAAGNVPCYPVSGSAVTDCGVVNANINTNSSAFTTNHFVEATGSHSTGDAGFGPAVTSLKPVVNDGVQYVSANGNDSNDGLSWGTAKLTVYGALLALPGGSSTTLTAGEGSIYLQTGTGQINAGGPAAGSGGVLILGSNDPHWNNTLASCARSSNVVTLTFNATHNYIVAWNSGTTYPAYPAGGSEVYYSGQNYKSLIGGNLNNTPSSTIGTDWELLGPSGGQPITVYGTAGGATSFNGNFTITGGDPVAKTVTFAQTGPNESCTASTGSVVPTGFLHESGSVNMIAAGQVTLSNSPGSVGVVKVAGGTGGPAPVPFAAFQQSGTNSHWYSSGILWSGCIAYAAGWDSNYAQSSGASTFSPSLIQGGTTIAFTSQSGCGPAIDWGRNVLYSNMQNVSLSALGEVWQRVTGITRSSNVATATLNSAMPPIGFKAGDVIDIFGASDATYNSPVTGFTIASIVDSTHFTYKNQGMDCASACVTGTIEVALNPHNCRRSAVCFEPSGGNSDLWIRKATFNGGGILATTAVGTGSGIFGEYLQGEGENPHSQSLYECTSGACPQTIISSLLGISDSADNPPVVRISPVGNRNSATIINCNAGNVGGLYIDGPAIATNCLMSSSSASSNRPNTSPAAKAEQGIFTTPGGATKAWVEVDNVKRAGLPTTVRFTNLAATAPASWTNVTGGNLTITTGVADLLTGTGAANLTVSTGNGEADSYSGTRTVKAGDYFIGGVWVQASSTAGVNNNFFNNGPAMITFSNSNTVGRGIGMNNNGSGAASIQAFPYAQDDGSWQWVALWDSVTTPDASETVKLKHFVNTAYPENLYAPILLHVPLSTISPYSISISSVSAGGGYATYTTGSTHALLVNQLVCSQGVSDTSFDGCAQILAVTSTTYQTAYAGGSSSSSGGTAYATNDSEAAEIAQNLSTYLNSCAIGQRCTVYGPSYGGAFSTQSSAYTLAVTDGWVNVTGNTTIKAPHAIPGQHWTVFNSGAGTVTLEADSGNFNGTASVSLTANTGMEVVCDGTNCFGH